MLADRSPEPKAAPARIIPGAAGTAPQLSRAARVASVRPKLQQAFWEDFHAIETRRAQRRHGDERQLRLGAGQDLRAQARALGAAVPSAAEGAGGLGLLGRKGLERHDQIQGLSLAAARQ